MKSIVTLLSIVGLAGSALAGPIAAKNPKAPVMPPQAPVGCDCFGPGLSLGVFGGAILNSEDALGGGVLAEYAINRNIAIQGSYGLYATDKEHHNFDAALVLRAPIDSICVAPYLLAGGGYSTNSASAGHWMVGGGLEARLSSSSCVGIFADGAYYFSGDEDEVEDHTIVRLGVKFPF